jgi:type 2 lantibiotic biosynthesis protein LanM
MLPWFRSRSGQVYDLSALGGVGGEEALATAWQGIETDNLKRQVVTGKIPRNRNVPFATDEEAELTRYVEEVVAGFREMYNLLLTQRGSLLDTSSPLDELVRSPMRLVFRDTSTYFSILKNSVDATLLRDGAERSIHLDLLSRVLLVSDSNVRFMPFLRAEKQALTELDIPFFTVHPKGSDMDLGFGKTVKNCFTQTGYQCIREKVLGLGEQDLEQQIGIIRGSFWAKASAQLSTTDGDAVRQVGSINLVPAGAVELLEEAIKIGQQLEGKALCGKDGSLTWIGLASHLNAQTSHFGQVGAALFDGLAGVALFLAALEKATGGAKWRQMAKGTFATIRRSVAAIETNLRTRRQSALQNVPLGLTGLGSIVYALTRVGLLLGEETAFEIACAAAVLIDPEATAIDNSLDVFNGQAGAILGLLALYNARPDSFLLDAAIGCGNRILACHAQSQNATIALRGGLSAGFVRGPAGVAHALFRLHRVTNQEQFLEAAWDLMPVAVAHGEWNPKDGSWLTGAAGLGLAWLANVTSMDQAHASIETALDACLEIPLDVSDQVCRGIAGRFDLLIEASQTEANRSGLLQLARKHAAWSIQRAARDGGFRLNPKLPVNAFLPGFYEGSAGVGYQLLRLAFPGVFPSVLLWS